MLSTVVAFLNIGTSEMMLIVFVALLLFGGKKLPELARGLGRGIREFKDASETIKRDISDQINNFEKDIEVKDVIVNDEPKKLNENNPTAPTGTYEHNAGREPDYYGSKGPYYHDDATENNTNVAQDDNSAVEPAPETPQHPVSDEKNT